MGFCSNRLYPPSPKVGIPKKEEKNTIGMTNRAAVHETDPDKLKELEKYFQKAAQAFRESLEKNEPPHIDITRSLGAPQGPLDFS